jgi:uncharacterized protein (DUF924 family)
MMSGKVAQKGDRFLFFYFPALLADEVACQMRAVRIFVRLVIQQRAPVLSYQHRAGGGH